MAYSDKIGKIQASAFAELFEISANNTTYYYTSHAQAVTWGGHSYLARSIKRGELSFSDRLRSVRVQVSAPLDAPFLQYIANAPPELAKVKITRKFLDSSDAVQIFWGYAISITIADNIASVECESETRMLRNKIPKWVFQAYCNHMLFDSHCGLDAADFAVDATVSDVTGSTITAAVFATFAAGYFILGHVKFQNDIRLVTNHVGAVLTLQIPFPNLAVDGVVTAYPGCDKSFEMCRDRFNNLPQRLAFDNIPSSNPCVFGFK